MATRAANTTEFVTIRRIEAKAATCEELDLRRRPKFLTTALLRVGRSSSSFTVYVLPLILFMRITFIF